MINIKHLISEIPNFRIACENNFYSIKGRAIHESPCIYRCGDLGRISNKTGANLAYKLGVQCHIDLRIAQETERFKSEILVNHGIVYKHFPLSEDSNKLRYNIRPNYKDYFNHYNELILQNKNMIWEILDYIANSQYNRFLLSCYAGKDRTGIIVLLLMFILEIDIESISIDYVLSGNYLMNQIYFFQKNWEKRGITKEQYLPRLQPDKRTITLLVENLILVYGGIKKFLYSLGLTETSMSKIKSKFFTYKSNHTLAID